MRGRRGREARLAVMGTTYVVPGRAALSASPLDGSLRLSLLLRGDRCRKHSLQVLGVEPCNKEAGLSGNCWPS